MDKKFRKQNFRAPLSLPITPYGATTIIFAKKCQICKSLTTFLKKMSRVANSGELFCKKCAGLQMLATFLQKYAPGCHILRFSCHVLPYFDIL